MPKILIVDDQKEVCQFLHETVASLNMEALVAGTGREALGLIQAHLPDLVLLDIGLPDMGGLKFFRRRENSAPICPLSCSPPLAM